MPRFSFNIREISFLAVLLLVALTIRFFLFPTQSFEGDINIYESWFGTAAAHGVRPFYNIVGRCDYPPFNVYIFWIAGSLSNAVSTYGIKAIYVLKLIPNLFDIGTAAIIYIFLRKQATLKQSLLGTTLYAFNPAVIYNAAVWGQFDAIYTFFVVLSLMFALKSKPKYSAAIFALAILTKPQSIALAPLLIYLIFRKNGIKNLLISVATFAATVLVVISPFEWSNPITFLTNIYFGAYGGYAYTSINAFNLWGLFGFWIPDGNLYILGWALFGISAASTIFVLHKRFKISGDWLVVFSAFTLFFAFFILPTRIHERYLFPTISMISLVFLFVKYSRPLYVALTGTFLVNQAYVLIASNAAVFAGLKTPNLTGDPIALTVSSINLVLFFYATALMLTELKGKGSFNQDKEQNTQLKQ